MPIRISANYLSQILVNDLNRSLGNMLELQRQAGSMLRIGDYADDPRGVGAIQRYDTLIANNDQYLRNLNRSNVIIESTDSALQDISGVLAELRELVLRESSALATDESRQTSVIEVENLTARVLDVLNTTVEGNYIFAGNRTDTVPFVRNGDTVIYQGNDETMTAQVGPDSVQALNLPGSEFMGALSATLSGRENLTPRLAATTQLDDLNLGNGWQPGRIELTDGNGDSWTVDLTGSATIDDVVTAIASETGGAITATLSPDGTGLQLDGVGPLAVTEVDGGQTATSLGIRGTSDAGTLIGRDIRPAIDASTALADIRALDGNLPLGVIEVETGGAVTTIDLAGAATLGDLKATFEAAMPGFEFRLDTGGVSVISGSTEAFHIRNAGAPDTATLLGIEGTGSPVRMFGVMEELRDALVANDPDAIRGTLVEIEELEQMIQSQLITIGGRQQDVEWTESLLMQRDTQLRAKRSLERDADVAEVSAALAQAEMSYQSSLLVTSKLFQSNLMMYL